MVKDYTIPAMHKEKHDQEKENGNLKQYQKRSKNFSMIIIFIHPRNYFKSFITLGILVYM